MLRARRSYSHTSMDCPRDAARITRRGSSAARKAARSKRGREGANAWLHEATAATAATSGRYFGRTAGRMLAAVDWQTWAEEDQEDQEDEEQEERPGPRT